MSTLSSEGKEIAKAVTDALRAELTALHSRVAYLTTKVEVTAAQSEAVNDRQEGRMRAAEALIKSQMGVSQKLFQAAVSLAVTRAWSALAPTPARIAAIVMGAGIGGYVATWMWMLSHPAVRMAMLSR